MGRPLHIALLVLVPTALWILLRLALPRLILHRMADSEAVLSTIAIASFATAFAKTTGFPEHFDILRLAGDPVRLLLILIGLVFCVVAVRAYRLERRTVPPEQWPTDTDAAVRDYVARYGNQFQLYGLGLALILLGV